MKALPAGLQSALDSGATTLAWCWRIVRPDGEVFGFTDHDRVLVFDGTSYEPESGFTASDMRAGSELAVDAQDAQGVLDSDRISEADILAGLWDGAEVEVWRVDWQNTAHRVLLRRGAIGEIRRGRVSFVAEMRSLAHVLNQPIGRVYQAGCDAAVGDSRCGVDLEAPAFKGTGAVVGVLRDRSFTASGLGAFAAGLFADGQLVWTSGPNDGRTSVVEVNELVAGATTLTLREPPPDPIAAGHGFVVRAGCDKRLETCAARFANVANFRGFPHIPGSDSLLRYASSTDGEGRVL